MGQTVTNKIPGPDLRKVGGAWTVQGWGLISGKGSPASHSASPLIDDVRDWTWLKAAAVAAADLDEFIDDCENYSPHGSSAFFGWLVDGGTGDATVDDREALYVGLPSV